VSVQGESLHSIASEPGMSLTLHFIFACCPHLNPIERLWGVMHKHLTHNKSYATYREFAEAALNFLGEKVPKNWPKFRDSVIDNFRVINAKDFRVLELLVIKTFRVDNHISVGELAEQLVTRDHGAAELISLLVLAKVVRRKADSSDRRRSLVIVTPVGDRCLARLATVHLERLKESKDGFLDLFNFDLE
jgi:DNA-binding MarR family transcriptional regulator